MVVARRVADDARTSACRSVGARPSAYVSSFSVSVSDEHRGRLIRGLRSADGAVERACRRERAEASMGRVASFVAPARRRRRSSRARSPSGSINLWQLAHTGFARCSSIRCAHRRGLPVSLALSRGRHVRRRRRRRRAEQIVENPLAAQHRRRAVRVATSRSACCPGRAARAGLVGHVHAPEVAARRRSESRSAAPAAR